jgi:hypothetical protein
MGILMALGTMHANLRRTGHDAISSLAGQALAAAAVRTALELEQGLSRIFGILGNPVDLLYGFGKIRWRIFPYAEREVGTPLSSPGRG